MKKNETPKSPVDRILEGFFARLREADELDEKAISDLEQLSGTGKLASLQSIKAVFAPPAEDQS